MAAGEQGQGAVPAPLRGARGLARIGAAAAWRTGLWTAETSARLGSQVARAAVNGQAPS